MGTSRELSFLSVLLDRPAGGSDSSPARCRVLDLAGSIGLGLDIGSGGLSGELGWAERRVNLIRVGGNQRPLESEGAFPARLTAAIVPRSQSYRERNRDGAAPGVAAPRSKAGDLLGYDDDNVMGAWERLRCGNGASSLPAAAKIRPPPDPHLSVASDMFLLPSPEEGGPLIFSGTRRDAGTSLPSSSAPGEAPVCPASDPSSAGRCFLWWGEIQPTSRLSHWLCSRRYD